MGVMGGGPEEGQEECFGHSGSGPDSAVDVRTGSLLTLDGCMPGCALDDQSFGSTQAHLPPQGSMLDSRRGKKKPQEDAGRSQARVVFGTPPVLRSVCVRTA